MLDPELGFHVWCKEREQRVQRSAGGSLLTPMDRKSGKAGKRLQLYS